VPGTVADVEAKFAVRPVVLVSTTPENVTPGALVVIVALPPSPAKVPVTAAVPDAPEPKYEFAVVVPPEGVVSKVTSVTVSVPAAPATVAKAIGSAAAASKAPAAMAFTKCRCIRRGLFIVNSLHS